MFHFNEGCPSRGNRIKGCHSFYQSNARAISMKKNCIRTNLLSWAWTTIISTLSHMYTYNICLLCLYISFWNSRTGLRNTFWSFYTPFSTLNSESNRCITLPSGTHVLVKFIIDRMLIAESFFCKISLLKKKKINPIHSTKTTLREAAIFHAAQTYPGNKCRSIATSQCRYHS